MQEEEERILQQVLAESQREYQETMDKKQIDFDVKEKQLKEKEEELIKKEKDLKKKKKKFKKKISQNKLLESQAETPVESTTTAETVKIDPAPVASPPIISEPDAPLKVTPLPGGKKDLPTNIL